MQKLSYQIIVNKKKIKNFKIKLRVNMIFQTNIINFHLRKEMKIILEKFFNMNFLDKNNIVLLKLAKILLLT